MHRAGDKHVQNRENFFHLHMVSDATGETLMTVGRASAAQFAQTRAVEHVHALVRAEKQLARVLSEIEAEPGIVLYTLVDHKISEKLEAHCHALGIPCVSVLEPIYQVMQSYLGAASDRRVGAQHSLDADYFRRIDALNFTMMHDDGQLAGRLEDADVVLVGVSRTSKTPTSIYLANRGVRTANVPLVPNIPLPPDVENIKKPLVVGLVATPRAHHCAARKPYPQSQRQPAEPRLHGQGVGCRRDRLHAQALRQAQLAGHRRHPPFDRGNRGGHPGASSGTPRGAGLRAGEPVSPVVLASGSPARRALLANAGLAFTVVPSTLDERVVEAPLIAGGAAPAEIAAALADAKAAEVSRQRPDALVIGADQTLDCDGHRGIKSETMAEARAQLQRLAGRAHRLHSAVAVARGGAVRWRHLDSATLTMRPLAAAEIDAYLRRVGEDILKSVGVYQLEGEGIRLFERIDGDYFTILGLPLLPLLAYLRGEGAIA